MVDYFAIALTHALLALAAWRLVQRADLECDPVADSGERGEDSAMIGNAPVSRPDAGADPRA